MGSRSIPKGETLTGPPCRGLIFEEGQNGNLLIATTDYHDPGVVTPEQHLDLARWIEARVDRPAIPLGPGPVMRNAEKLAAELAGPKTPLVPLAGTDLDRALGFQARCIAMHFADRRHAEILSRAWGIPTDTAHAEARAALGPLLALSRLWALGKAAFDEAAQPDTKVGWPAFARAMEMTDAQKVAAELAGAGGPDAIIADAKKVGAGGSRVDRYRRLNTGEEAPPENRLLLDELVYLWGVMSEEEKEQCVGPTVTLADVEPLISKVQAQYEELRADVEQLKAARIDDG